MQEEAGNEYKGLSIGDGFALSVRATQFNYEEGAFGDGYDADAQWPSSGNAVSNSASAPVNTTSENKVADKVTLISDDRKIFADVPAGVQLDAGVDKVTLTVSNVPKSEANVTVGENEEARSIDVHIDGVAETNDVVMPITIKELLPVGLNMGNYRFYHVENSATVEMTLLADGATPVHNNYEYDPATGDVVLHLKSFSEIALVADTENAWEGNFDYSWYTNAIAPVDGESNTVYAIANADQLAAFGAIVGGMAKDENGNAIDQDSFKDKTVKLLADINLGDDEKNNKENLIFYPIGYNSSDGKYEKTGVAVTTGFYNFCGTFDGNGNTIANFYQNTWEMKGDHNWYSPEEQYYRDGMGLFGKVYGGIIKNLTVENFSSDGEIATTGVIAAYADGATFENIAIINCNPRVYNIGNGGIVGCVGWYAKEANLKTTFTNITVDNSNKISALWGSYDVACGGIVGQYYPTSGQTSEGSPKNAGIDLINCHVAAQMDVYNDVCGNYQYYAYRYAGMIIGSIRENTTNEDGKTIPDMTGISAKGCTVNYGDWNDYYYCEFETNGHPSYSGPDDYKFSRVPHSELEFTDSNGNGVVDANERESVTGCKHDHTGAEDNKAIYLPFHQLFTGYGWGVNSIGLEKYSGIVTNLDITEGDQEESVQKFETKFTGDFLYRVGNSGTVSLGTLFEAKYGQTINNSGVWVKVDAIDENMNVSGTFTANTSDWTKGTIQFSGTGVVKVTIQDYNFCTPTVLYLEVIDAVNAPTAMSATANNVVLLQDCGFSSIDVKNGYTLYGNGFTLTASSDQAARNMSYGFVQMENGTLDNVQIICPNFAHAILYTKNTTENNNPTDADGRYYNIRSAVVADKNSKITNSYISGGRAAVYASSGTLVIENSTIEGGAAANIHTGTCNLTLRDVTLIQEPKKATTNGPSAPSKETTLMGVSVFVQCDTNGLSYPITLEGTLNQYAWANEDYSTYVPDDGKNLISTVMSQTDYVQKVNGKDSINLGIVFMPYDTIAVKDPVSNGMIIDKRADGSLKYGAISISNVAYVYSSKNISTEDLVITKPSYVPSKQGAILPTITFTDTNDSRVFSTSFDATNNYWASTLKVDVDQGVYEFNFSNLLAQKYGKNLNYAITLVDGTAVDKNATISLADSCNNEYVLTITDDHIYDQSGQITNNTTIGTYVFKIIATKTSIPAPSWESTTLTGAGIPVGDDPNSDWNAAVPVLDGLSVRYWSKAQGKEIVLNFSDIPFDSVGQQNGTNNSITITVENEYTLTISTSGFKDNPKDNGMPVVVNNDGKNTLYFTVASSSNYVSKGTTSRTITINYVFTDANNTTSLTKTLTAAVTNDGTEQEYTDFCNGTMTDATTCITPDTLVTLADGTQVRVDSLNGDETLLVWNMETGKLDKAPIMFVDSEAKAEYEIIHLYFSDGTDVKVISEHGFWDYNLNKYVYLDRYADKYIGHTFAKQNGNGLKKVQLVDVVIETEVTTAWSPVTAGHLCYFVNGMLSMPGGVGGLFNIFEVDAKTMTYDFEAMQKDIETYGLYTYEELNAICPLSEEMFNAAGGAYLKVSIGKGNLTIDELIYMINRYSKFI